MIKNYGNSISIHECYNMPAVYAIINKGSGWTVEVNGNTISRKPCQQCPWCGERLR
jgi:hypothetical protein